MLLCVWFKYPPSLQLNAFCSPRSSQMSSSLHHFLARSAVEFILVIHSSVKYAHILLMLHLQKRIHFYCVNSGGIYRVESSVSATNRWIPLHWLCFKCFLLFLPIVYKIISKTGETLTEQEPHLLNAHCCSATPPLSPSLPIMSPRSLEMCWLTATHAHRSPRPFSPSTSPRHPCLSSLSLHHHHHHHLTPPSPASPSFWWVGSSEVLAVCIAKGNVSSAHGEREREREKNGSEH